MAEILYRICGNKIAQLGRDTQLVGTDAIKIDDVGSHISDTNYYYTVRHEAAQIVYMMRRYDVASVEAGRTGSIAIAIAIPYGWRMANGRSPYDLLNELWNTYRDRYMEWGEFTRLYKYTSVEEEETPFAELIAKYPLRPYTGAQPIPMQGSDFGWQGFGSEDKIREVMLDTRYPGLETYSEIVLTVEGSSNRPMLGIAGPRCFNFNVYCNGQSIGDISPERDTIMVQPQCNLDFYTVVPIILTYNNIVQLYRINCDTDAHTYMDGDTQVDVDYAQERIDCHMEIRARKLPCRVIINGRNLLDIERDLKCRFNISDFELYVGGIFKAVDASSNEFILMGEEIGREISVQWCKDSAYRDEFDIEVTINNIGDERHIHLDIVKRLGIKSPIPHYTVKVTVSRKKGDNNKWLRANIKCGNATDTLEIGTNRCGKKELNSDVAQCINNGDSIIVSIDSPYDEEYDKASFTKDRFVSGFAEVTIEPKSSNNGLIDINKIISVKMLIVCLLCAAITGGALYYFRDSIWPQPEPKPVAIETVKRLYKQYKEAKTLTEIINLGNEWLSGESPKISKLSDYNYKESDEWIQHMEAGYQAATIIDGFNASKSESKSYEKKTYNEQKTKTETINKLSKYKNNGREDLGDIIDTFKGDAPLSKAILGEKKEEGYPGPHSSKSINDWVEFCKEVNEIHNKNSNSNQKTENKVTGASQVTETGNSGNNTTSTTSKVAQPTTDYTNMTSNLMKEMSFDKIDRIITEIKTKADKEDKSLGSITYTGLKGSKYSVQDFITQYDALKNALNNNALDEVMGIAQEVKENGGPFGEDQTTKLKEAYSDYYTNKIDYQSWFVGQEIKSFENLVLPK